jgi:hypothetical protein
VGAVADALVQHRRPAPVTHVDATHILLQHLCVGGSVCVCVCAGFGRHVRACAPCVLQATRARSGLATHAQLTAPTTHRRRRRTPSSPPAACWCQRVV